MDQNQKIGLNTGKKVSSDEIKSRIRTAQTDYDFYSTPLEYTSVEPQSANHLFGNGKWKKTVITALGNDVFEQYAEKYGNKPVDFKITKLITPHSKFFAPGELIQIKDEKGTYSSEIKILAISGCEIMVMIPFTCDSSGKILNLSRKNGAQKAMNKMNQLLSDMYPEAEQNYEPVKQEPTNETIVDQELKAQPETIESYAPQKTGNKVFKTVLTVIAITAIIYVAYRIIKKTNNP